MWPFVRNVTETLPPRSRMFADEVGEAAHARVRNLIRRGLTISDACRAAYRGRGPWRCSRLRQINVAYPKRFFSGLGLVALHTQWQRLRNASCTAAERNRTPGGVGGRRSNPTSYPMLCSRRSREWNLVGQSQRPRQVKAAPGHRTPRGHSPIALISSLGQPFTNAAEAHGRLRLKCPLGACQVADSDLSALSIPDIASSQV